MGLSLRHDPTHTSGGFVILEGPGLAGVSALTVEDVSSGLFLGTDGEWAATPHAFPVSAVPTEPAALRLGPAIAAVIPAGLRVALRSASGRDLGGLSWHDVRSRPPGEAAAWPPRRRSLALPGTVGAMVAVGLAAGAYMLWHSPLPPDADGGPRCARAFDARLHAARGGSDAGLVALAEEALAAGCGRQAFDAVDAVGRDASEPAAWMLARFADPNETRAVYRQAATADPARAAAAYLAWAPHSPRMAEALKRLCATDGPALDRDPALRRGCGG